MHARLERRLAGDGEQRAVAAHRKGNRVPVRQVGGEVFQQRWQSGRVDQRARHRADDHTVAERLDDEAVLAQHLRVFLQHARLLVSQRDGDARQQPLGVRFLVGSQLFIQNPLVQRVLVDDIDRV